MRFEHPDCLEKLVLKLGVIPFQFVDPIPDGADGLRFRHVHKAQLGELPVSLQRMGELHAKFCGSHVSQGGGLQ